MSKKSTEAWEHFVSGLSPQTQDALRQLSSDPHLTAQDLVTDPDEDDAERLAYEQFAKTLLPETTEILLQTPKPKSPPPEVERDQIKWGIVESLDGEWAQIRLFRTSDSLVQRLQQLEGKDVIAWCFYGVPLMVTKGPQRYLNLPDGRFQQIPLFAGGPHETVTIAELGNVEFEDSGYLGPPELTETVKPVVAVSEDSEDDEDDAN